MNPTNPNKNMLIKFAKALSTPLKMSIENKIPTTRNKLATLATSTRAVSFPENKNSSLAITFIEDNTKKESRTNFLSPRVV